MLMLRITTEPPSPLHLAFGEDQIGLELLSAVRHLVDESFVRFQGRVVHEEAERVWELAISRSFEPKASKSKPRAAMPSKDASKLASGV